MCVFKAVNEKYKFPDDLKRLVNYAVKPDHCIQNAMGAQGLIMGNGDEMSQQMLNTKKYFHKEDKRQALHYILSFDPEEEMYIGLEEAISIGYKVASMFQRWQVVFGVHTNTEHLHIHFVVNSVSYEDGKCISVGPFELQGIQSNINNIVSNCVFYNYIQSLPEEEKMEATFKRISGMGGIKA